MELFAIALGIRYLTLRFRLVLCLYELQTGTCSRLLKLAFLFVCYQAATLRLQALAWVDSTI